MIQQAGLTTPETPTPTANKAPTLPPKSGIPPDPVPPVELTQDDPMPGANCKVQVIAR